jgi:phage antirepressor YoqD-like protein
MFSAVFPHKINNDQRRNEQLAIADQDQASEIDVAENPVVESADQMEYEDSVLIVLGEQKMQSLQERRIVKFMDKRQFRIIVVHNGNVYRELEYYSEIKNHGDE